MLKKEQCGGMPWKTFFFGNTKPLVIPTAAYR